MKMITAILRDEDIDAISTALINAGYRVTRVASSGGFLRRGSTTIMIGVSDEKVDGVIQLIRQNCGPVTEPGVKRAALFVLPVVYFEQL